MYPRWGMYPSVTRMLLPSPRRLSRPSHPPVGLVWPHHDTAGTGRRPGTPRTRHLRPGRTACSLQSGGEKGRLRACAEGGQHGLERRQGVCASRDESRAVQVGPLCRSSRATGEFERALADALGGPDSAPPGGLCRRRAGAHTAYLRLTTTPPHPATPGGCGTTPAAAPCGDTRVSAARTSTRGDFLRSSLAWGRPRPGSGPPSPR